MEESDSLQNVSAPQVSERSQQASKELRDSNCGQKYINIVGSIILILCLAGYVDMSRQLDSLKKVTQEQMLELKQENGRLVMEINTLTDRIHKNSQPIAQQNTDQETISDLSLDIKNNREKIDAVISHILSAQGFKISLQALREQELRADELASTLEKISYMVSHPSSMISQRHYTIEMTKQNRAIVNRIKHSNEDMWALYTGSRAIDRPLTFTFQMNAQTDEEVLIGVGFSPALIGVSWGNPQLIQYQPFKNKLFGPNGRQFIDAPPATSESQVIMHVDKHTVKWSMNSKEVCTFTIPQERRAEPLFMMVLMNKGNSELAIKMQ